LTAEIGVTYTKKIVLSYLSEMALVYLDIHV